MIRSLTIAMRPHAKTMVYAERPYLAMFIVHVQQALQATTARRRWTIAYLGRA